MSKLASIATTLLTLVTILAFFGRIHWLLDLLAHFRIQYAIAALLLIPLLTWIKKWRFLTLAILTLVINGVLIAPYTSLGGSVSAEPPTAPTLRVLSFNINAGNSQPGNVLQYILDSNADAVTLLEITPQFASRLSELSDTYPHQHIEALAGHFGIALISKHPFKHTDTLWLGNPQIATLFANIDINDNSINLFGIHPYPPFNASTTTHRDKQLAEIADLVANFNGPTIVMGDFNATPWAYPMRQFEATTNFHNSALGKNIPPTWFATIYPFGIPIDHIMLSPDLSATTHTVGPKTGSDHRPILVDIAILE